MPARVGTSLLQLCAHSSLFQLVLVTADWSSLWLCHSWRAYGSIEPATYVLLASLTGCCFQSNQHPVGDVVVTGGQDGAVRFWDARSGRCVAAHEVHVNERGHGAVGNIAAGTHQARLLDCAAVR